MHQHLSRAGVALGTLALVVTSLLLSPSPATAVTTGKLVVNVVDQYGRPTMGVVMPRDTDGLQFAEDGATGGQPYVVGTTHTFTVPAGGYNLQSITPWSGMTCVETSPCTFATPPTEFGTAITVAGGATATYTIHVDVPTITGTGTIGSPLAVQLPPNLTSFLTVLTQVPVFGGGAVTYQWLRGGADIPAATGASYSTVPADAASQVTARLLPAPGQTFVFTSFGYTVPPFTTNAIATGGFTPAETKTRIKLAKRLRAGERATMKVKVKAASGVPEGGVTIRIGKLVTKTSLEDGTVLYTLPRMGAGRYRIVVSYAGSDYFARSTAKARLTVESPR